MEYTISQISEITNLTSHTLRYYDKEGLLPFLERTSAGNRIFKDSDLEWLSVICCLKNTGMQIKDIKTFIEWCKKGDCTLEQRRQMFLSQRKIVEQQISELQKNLNTIDYKIRYYNTACEAGTEAIHKISQGNCNPASKVAKCIMQNGID